MAQHEPVKRPYVICHVFASIDGRIDGCYMFDPTATVSARGLRELRRWTATVRA